MNKYRDQICAFIDAHRDEMIGKWRDFVNLEGRYDEKENVEKAQAWFRKELVAAGFRTWTVPSRPDRCVSCLVFSAKTAARPRLCSAGILTLSTRKERSAEKIRSELKTAKPTGRASST